MGVAAVDDALSALLGSLPAGSDEAMVELERVVRRVQARQAAIVTEATVTGSFMADEHRSPVSWMQATVNCTRGTATRRVQVAAMLAALPVVAAADAAGEVGADQLWMLAGLHANERARDHLAEAQELLLGHAKQLTAREFRLVCQRWEAHADPDGAHRDHEAARANRSLSITQNGAGFMLRAQGDALTGDVLQGLIEACARAEFEVDVSDRAARYGADAAKWPLARTAAQRRFDGFCAAMLQTQFSKTKESKGGAEPLVVIHCTPDVLEWALAEFFGVNIPPTGSSTRMRLCETSSGAPVDLRDLAVAALIGRVQRIVSDPNGNTINLGRKSRLFVGSARDAVLLAGDRCCWPGCELRTGQIEIDHVTPWARLLGETDPVNGAPMCGHHNRAKHTGRYTVSRDENGWHTHRPDGSEIAPRHGE